MACIFSESLTSQCPPKSCNVRMSGEIEGLSVGTADRDGKRNTSKMKFQSSRTGVSNTNVHLNGLAHIKRQVYGECFNIHV
jgi:hypothetical protein